MSLKPSDTNEKTTDQGDKSSGRGKITANLATDVKVKREGGSHHISISNHNTQSDHKKVGSVHHTKANSEMKHTAAVHEKTNTICNSASAQARPSYPDTDEEDDEDYDNDGEDDYSDDDDDDEYDDESDDQVTGYCLHCHLPPPPTDGTGSSATPTALGIQVSCDECHAFICSSCHWCHEFQANHEIRVCDRCDAFFCKACDEMDQCEDCGEVVCTGCGSLCSCKFCGCGLCEECATACGRCGIVLCSRDAKFAVECDTCKLPYCLVCLASGTKEPCVRCGCRTSKRVEQLVHLRLKSIYKAFKQSGAALGVKASINEGHEKKSGRDGHSISAISAEIISGDISQISKKIGRGTALSIPLPPSIAKYAKSHAKDADAKNCTINTDKCIRKEDLGAVLHAAAATAASVAHARCTSPDDLLSESMTDLFFNTSMHSSDSFESSRHRIRSGSKLMPHSSIVSPKVKSKNVDVMENNRPRTLADADAAAAALLAELDEEKMLTEASNQAKKNKKKKKKEKLQAAKEKDKPQNDDGKLSDGCKNDGHYPTDNSLLTSQAGLYTVADRRDSVNEGAYEEGDKVSDHTKDLFYSSHSTSLPRETLDKQNDDLENMLAQMIELNDVTGIETILFQMKGVPGRAALRKNAKKALKRILESQTITVDQNEVRKTDTLEKSPPVQPLAPMNPTVPAKMSSDPSPDSPVNKVPEPLVKVVSQNNRTLSGVTSNSSSIRSDCVMHLHPSIVGWVIGRGGQRIRDLMEESGAKLWIDQESMGPKDMRIVYVSGPRKSVDTAVRMVKDLVSKAPVYTPSTVQDVFIDEQDKIPSFHAPSDIRTVSPCDDDAVDKTAIHISNNDPTTHLRLYMTLPNEVKLSLTADQHHSMPISGVSSKISSPLTCNQNLYDKGSISQELSCDPRFVPLLIGRRGWTIKQIQDTSGARVDIDQSVSPRKVIISGERSQVELAMKLVRDVLSFPHVQPQASSELQASSSIMSVDEDTILPVLHPVLGQPLIDEPQGVQPQLLDPFDNKLAPRNQISHSRPIDNISMLPFETVEAVPTLSITPFPCTQFVQYSLSNTISNDHQKGLLPPPGIFQHSSAIQSLQQDPLSTTPLGPNAQISGYKVHHQPREDYPQEQLLERDGNSFSHHPQTAFPHNLSRQDSGLAPGRDIFLHSNFSTESFSENHPNSNFIQPVSSRFHGPKVDGDLYGISGGLLNAIIAQNPLPCPIPTPNDRDIDIDEMFGPTTMSLNEVNNAKGHISPLIAEFASAMNFDNLTDQGNSEKGWTWDTLAQNSSVPISTLFPSTKSKSKRSSYDHNIGLGGVKLDM